MIYIKDMDIPVDCLACRISCKNYSYLVTGRPEGCPLEEAKTGDLISRADAIEAVRMSEHRITIADEQGGVGTVKWDMWGVYTAEAVEAIKALPSAELPKGDLISRRWLLDLYGDYIGDNGDPKYHVPLEVVRQNIIDAPPAEAVQGEWKPFDLTWGRNVYFCTACQESTEVPTVNGQPSYNFCPNCGAKMKGGDSE